MQTTIYTVKNIPKASNIRLYTKIKIPIKIIKNIVSKEEIVAAT